MPIRQSLLTEALNPPKREQAARELSELASRLSPEGRKIFQEEFAPMLMEPERIPEAIAQIYALDFQRMPVSIRQFIEEPEYLGGALEGSTYPLIIDKLEELFEGEYTEVCLCGGIGWGKTRMAEVGVLYELYRLSCMREPAKTYGLIPGSSLVFPVVSIKKEQAQTVFFNGIFEIAKRTKYFREVFPYEKNLTTEMRFQQSLKIYPVATNEGSLLGEGVFGAVFDEMNFMAKIEHSRLTPEGGEYDEAAVLYNRISRRITSRMNMRGRLPGHIWMISSAKYPDDFTERKKIEALSNPKIFVCDYKAWDTKPKSIYLQGTFKVEVGDKTRHSRVLQGNETDVISEKVIDVPLDYLDAFTRDPDSCVRDFAGISLLAIRPFMTRYDKIQKMFELGKQHGLRHPFTKLEVTLQDPTDKFIPENLHFAELPVTDERGRPVRDDRGRPLVRVKLHPGPYYGHVDLAKTVDACGVGAVHIVGEKRVQRTMGDYRLPERRPVMRVDLILRVVRPPHGEIQAPKVRSLWYEMHRLGMEFGLITYDSWGSHETLQILRSEGYNVDNFSVDDNTDPYEALKSAIYDERLLCYEFPQLQEELLTLIFDEKRGKVDHRPGGQKDLADALAGAVAHAETAFYGGVQMRPEAPVSPGIPSSGVENPDDPWEKLQRGEPLTDEDWERL
jgi:hypothetical protein